MSTSLDGEGEEEDVDNGDEKSTPIITVRVTNTCLVPGTSLRSLH